jgi:cyclophilin family peptidyl-prolyl cis-trans isomerase
MMRTTLILLALLTTCALGPLSGCDETKNTPAQKPKAADPAAPKTEPVKPAESASAPTGKTPAFQVKLETTKGDIIIELDREKAPITVANFLRYVDEGKYDGTIFHRVIPRFMIQGGGFTPDMKKLPTGAPIKNEMPNGLSNKRGTIAMARLNSPNTATNQFFINHKDNLQLDTYTGGYAVFGKVVKGMDVVDAIAGVKTQTVMVFNEEIQRNVPMQDVPVEQVIMTKVSRL